MFEFILVVYLTKNSPPEYVGHFESCAFANIYVEQKYKNVHYTTCLHEEHMYIPDNLHKRIIKVIGNKIEP